MLRKKYGIFRKHFIYKEKSQNLKTVKILDKYMRASLYMRGSGDKKSNTNFFQITCFKESKNMVVENNNDKLLEKP